MTLEKYIIKWKISEVNNRAISSFNLKYFSLLSKMKYRPDYKFLS